MRRLGPIYVVLALLGAIMFAAAASAAVVPPVSGPLDPADMINTLNRVINNINLILSPLTGGPVPAKPGAPGISISQPSASSNIVIAPAPGGSNPNVGIQLLPTGNGDVVFFGSYPGNVGNIRFANAASIVPATGFAVCPGGPPGQQPPLGVNTVVKGYIIIKDWLGTKHGWATC